MRFLFNREPDRETELFAEACALVDDGLDPDFVLALYPDDAEWLAPLLEARGDVAATFEGEQPSYFFEASLKSKFLAAGREAPAPAGEPAGYLPLSQVRTALASAGVVLAAGVMSVFTLGFVTADGAVPGDWNYGFKLAQERVEYTLARGDTRVNVQISQAQERVYEISKRGDNVSANDIQRLNSELSSLETLTKDKELDELQKAQVRALREGVKTVLASVSEKQPTIEPIARDTINKADGVAIAVGLGGTTAVTPPPSPTPTPTAEATGTATPTPEPTGTATPTPTPTETATPTPTVSATPTGSATPSTETATPNPTETTP